MRRRRASPDQPPGFGEELIGETRAIVRRRSGHVTALLEQSLYPPAAGRQPYTHLPNGPLRVRSTLGLRTWTRRTRAQRRGAPLEGCPPSVGRSLPPRRCPVSRRAASIAELEPEVDALGPDVGVLEVEHRLGHVDHVAGPA